MKRNNSTCYYFPFVGGMAGIIQLPWLRFFFQLIVLCEPIYFAILQVKYFPPIFRFCKAHFRIHFPFFFITLLDLPKRVQNEFNGCLLLKQYGFGLLNK